MLSLILSMLVSALSCLALTPLLRRALLSVRPGRRSHAGGAEAIPVPRMGGVAVLLAAGTGVVAPYWLQTDVARQMRPGASLVLTLLPALLVVLALGIADDLFDLSPQFKLLIQIAASLLAFASGVRVTGFFGHLLPIWAALLITVLWLVGCTNAFNLLDGMDGLTAGVALLATITVMIHALLNGNLDLALLTAALSGGLAAFLCFNFFPASIYLGDTGSLSIGFLLGCFALLWMDKSTTMLGLTAPLLALAVPLFDTTLSIARRWIAHQPVLEGDRSHVHHRLVQLGLTPRKAVLLLYGVAAVGALAGLLLANLRQEHVDGLVVLAFLAIAAVGVRRLDFTEFTEARQEWRRGISGYRRTVRCRIEFNRLLAGVELADSGEAIWESLCRLADLLALQVEEFRIGPEENPAWRRTRPSQPAAAWLLQIPLGENGALGMIRLAGASDTAMAIPLQDLALQLNMAVAARIRAWPAAARAQTATMA